MNKELNTNYLSTLCKTSNYISFYDPPILFDSHIPFSKADELLFDIPTMNDKLINLYINNFIGVCLNMIVDGVYEVITCFNIVTNTFDLFFSLVVDNLSNSLKRKVALSL